MTPAFTYFTMPVEIKINYAAGDTTIKLFNNAQIQEYFITLPYEPMSIVFDPENWIVKDVLSIVSEVKEENYPSEFFLSQNYPNPWNPITKIKYSIPQSTHVYIKIFNTVGKEFGTLVNEEKPAGEYEIEFYAEDFPSGVYFYQLKAGEFAKTRKMILLK